MSKYQKLVKLAMAMALVVIMLGAYTRLTDAGLGCPDWPGCYGFLSVPMQAEHVAIAEQRFPGEAVVAHKAWSEMTHRYVAGTFGIVVLLLCLFSVRKQYTGPKWLPWCLLMLVAGQATLGMLTVTMNLQPLIVMGHLLGGFTLFSLLNLLRMRLQPTTEKLPQPPMLLAATAIVLAMVVMQIALGGWLAANYAAPHCTGLPLCDGNWQQDYSLAAIFHLPQGHASYEYGVLPQAARMSIHVTHRLMAVVVAIAALSWALWLWRAMPAARHLAAAVALLVVMQISLGISLIWWVFPVWLAVLHNVTALMLANAVLMSLVWLWQTKEVRDAASNHIQQQSLA